LGKTECEVESTFRYGLIAISFLLYESGKYKILVCQNFIYIPGDVAWWQRVWDLHSRSRVRVRACTSCKILGQPVFYSLTWAHKVRFPGSVVSSNPKKKKNLHIQSMAKTSKWESGAIMYTLRQKFFFIVRATEQLLEKVVSTVICCDLFFLFFLCISHQEKKIPFQFLEIYS